MPATTVEGVGRKIDLDDLLDAAEVAEALGLASRNVVGVYRGRYPGFPPPVIDRGACLLWLRADIEAWASETGRTAGPT
jgi:predicted DNA-binding transcriptional regulator AlpA